MFLLVSSVAFADTITVIKGGGITGKTFAMEYKNMKMSKTRNLAFLKDNEYMTWDGALYYKINGKVYLTSMFEVEFD